MDINWLSVVLHLVAARFRLHARIVLLLAAWLLQAESGGAEGARDVDASMGHASVEVTVTRYSGIRIVEVRMVERVVNRVVRA